MQDKDISIAKCRSLRSIGYNEGWLQEKIFEDPTILGLGDLLPIKREKRQKSGGRLDILLKNPDDNAMFEVEVMLGETDEAHIIRTIEYWDFERRQYPQRQHYAVIVAERVTRRFFNVIQLLSASIPIIAIQYSVHETFGGYHLAFTTVLDVYSEPEDETEEAGETVDEKWWGQKADWVLEVAKSFLQICTNDLPGAQLIFVQSYIAIRIDGRNIFWFGKKGKPNAYFGFRYSIDDSDKIIPILDDAELSYRTSGRKFYVTVSQTKLREHGDALLKLIQAVKSDRDI